MSVWKSALLVSPLCLSLSSVLASPSAIPITKADVYGFWSVSVDAGLDIHLQIETFFAADGSYEGRAFVDYEGEIQKIHEFGAWTLVKDSIYTFTDLNRCKTEGEDVDGCNEVEGDPVTIGLINGVKTLVGEDGGEVGNYIGPGKQFTISDLFKSSALAGRSGNPQGNGARRLRVQFPGNGSKVRNGVGN